MDHTSKHEISEFFQEIVGELNRGLAVDVNPVARN